MYCSIWHRSVVSVPHPGSLSDLHIIQIKSIKNENHSAEWTWGIVVTSREVASSSNTMKTYSHPYLKAVANYSQRLSYIDITVLVFCCVYYGHVCPAGNWTYNLLCQVLHSLRLICIMNVGELANSRAAVEVMLPCYCLGVWWQNSTACSGSAFSHLTKSPRKFHSKQIRNGYFGSISNPDVFTHNTAQLVHLQFYEKHCTGL